MKILKSMRFKFSILVLLLISSVVFAKPPVIKSFKATGWKDLTL
ncbi:hypothetical protein [Thermotomaculum hydrothermale]|nr:hypothetical protein [Thermotomaculum hydrothermale]